MRLSDLYRAVRTGVAPDMQTLGFAKILRRAQSTTVSLKTVSGVVLDMPDSIGAPLQGLRIFGRSEQDGTPTPESPVPIVAAGDTGGITVDVSGKKLVCSTPNGLPAVPVKSGGTYTDESGQQWIADEIDFERGVYKRYIAQYAGDDFELISTNTNTSRYRITSSRQFYGQSVGGMLCTHISTYGWHTSDNIHMYTDRFNGWLFLPVGFDFNAHKGDIRVLAVYASPIEHPLSADELAQYRRLYTSAAGTQITNDAGVWTEASYYGRN